jgi:hypothetical protein
MSRTPRTPGQRGGEQGEDRDQGNSSCWQELDQRDGEDGRNGGFADESYAPMGRDIREWAGHARRWDGLVSARGMLTKRDPPIDR